MSSDTLTAYVSRAHVLIDGSANALVSQCVVAALVEETLEGLFRCELVLNNFGESTGGNWDYLFFRRDVLDFGKEITLRLGAGNPPRQVFKGRITALEADFPAGGGARLVVLAEDPMQDLRMTRRTRSFEDMSDDDIISEIARDHALSPKVDLGGPTHRSLAQVNLSDLAFIRERARHYDADVWLDDTTLCVSRREAQDTGDVQLGYGANLHEFRVRADLTHQCTEMIVNGWDVSQKDTVSESADDSVLQAELEGDTCGSKILQAAFGERAASFVHHVPLNAAEARQTAKGRYLDRARRFVTGSGTADGDARLHAGDYVFMHGLGRMFDGKYYLTRVRHTFTLAAGFRSEFDVERPGIGG